MLSVRSAVAQFLNYVRRFVPSPLLPLVVAIRAGVARHRRAAWADARKHMQWVVGEDQPEEVIDRLAVGYLQRMIWRGEVRWHPRRVWRQPVTGVERIRPLCEAKTGFIIGF